MSFLELEESGGHGDLSRYYSKDDLNFLEKIQDGLDEKPLADKIKSAVPMIILTASFGVLSLGFILGSPEIFAGGVGLSSLWQTSNWISNWRDHLAIET